MIFEINFLLFCPSLEGALTNEAFFNEIKMGKYFNPFDPFLLFFCAVAMPSYGLLDGSFYFIFSVRLVQFPREWS